MGKILRRKMTEYEQIAEWSADDDASFQAAQDVLAREIEAGYTAVRSEDGHNDPITELPRDADRIILTTAMGGG